MQNKTETKSKSTGLAIGPVASGIAINNKSCGCCNIKHPFAPFDSAQQMGLLWWDCKCGSTLAYEIDKLNLFAPVDSEVSTLLKIFLDYCADQNIRPSISEYISWLEAELESNY